MHHAAILVRDFDASLLFWRDALGLKQIMHATFDGDWRTLFNADAGTLHSIFLGNPERPDAGVVEIVEFPGLRLDAYATPAAPTNGFFLLSFNVDLTATLGRLGDLGLGGELREIVVRGVRMAVVQDPDGVRVELLDLAGMPDMSDLTPRS